MGRQCQNGVCFPSIYHVVCGFKEGKRVLLEPAANVLIELSVVTVTPGCYILDCTFSLFKGHLFLVLWWFMLCSLVSAGPSVHCQCQGNVESAGR